MDEMHPTWGAFFDELEKIKTAGPLSAAAGAGVGAALSGAKATSKEMNLRMGEEGKYTPEQLKDARKKRLKYHAGTVAAGTAAGAVGGHYGGKVVKALGEELENVGKKVEKGVKDGMEKGVIDGAKKVGKKVSRPARRLRVAGKKAWKFLNTPIGKLIRKK